MNYTVHIERTVHHYPKVKDNPTVRKVLGVFKVWSDRALE